MAMSWFERLTGFPERSYDETRARLSVSAGRLHSKVNGRSWAVGELRVASLQSLRERAAAAGAPRGQLRLSIVEGDARELHRQPEYEGALFQVASQFNALEMTGPEITPERGVAGYEHDHTQGPACAIAAGAATIYRNYFAAVGGGLGQTKDRQIDGLADLGATLSEALSRPVGSLWSMRNGYAMCSAEGLRAIADHLTRLSDGATDALRARLSIVVQSGVEATEAETPGRLVSQAFCSALPVAYVGLPEAPWAPFATLLLEAAYEAAMWAAAINAAEHGSHIVLLTLLGGGAFGNDDKWIMRGLRRALDKAADFDLDVRIVSYGRPSRSLNDFVRGFGDVSWERDISLDLPRQVNSHKKSGVWG
jgi:hypothetical protein